MRGKYIAAVLLILCASTWADSHAQTLDLSNVMKPYIRSGTFQHPHDYAVDAFGNHYVISYDQIVKVGENLKIEWVRKIHQKNYYRILPFEDRHIEGFSVACIDSAVFMCWVPADSGSVESTKGRTHFKKDPGDSIVMLAKFDLNGGLKWLKKMDKGKTKYDRNHNTTLLSMDSLLLVSYVHSHNELRVTALSPDNGKVVWDKYFTSEGDAGKSDDQFSSRFLDAEIDSFGYFYLNVAHYGVTWKNSTYGPYNFGTGTKFNDNGGSNFIVKMKQGSGKVEWVGQMGVSFGNATMSVDPLNSNLYLHSYAWDSINISLKGDTIPIFKDSSKHDTAWPYRVVISRYDNSGNFKKRVYLNGLSAVLINDLYKLNDTTLLIQGKFRQAIDLDPGPDTTWLRTNKATRDFDGFILLLDTNLNYLHSYSIKFGRDFYQKGLPSARIATIGYNIRDRFLNILYWMSFGTADIDFGPSKYEINASGKKDPCLVTYDMAKMGVAGSVNGPDTVCVRSHPYTFSTTTVQNAVKYRWHLPPGAAIIGDSIKNTVQVQFTQPFVKDSVYVVVVRGQQRSVSRAMALVMPTTQQRLVQGTIAHCHGDSISMTCDTTGLKYYHYYQNQLVDSTTTNGYVWDSLGHGSTYYTDVLMNSGCSVRSDTLEFTVHDLPIVSVSITAKGKAVCNGDKLFVDINTKDSFNLYVDSAFIIRGKTARRRIFTYQNASIIRIESTDDKGCTGIDQDTLKVWPLPNLKAARDTAICYGDSVQLSATSNFAHFWGGGFKTGQWVKPSKSSNYIVSSVSTQGCYANDTQTVVVHALPTVKTYSDTSICQQSPLKLTASGASSYQWIPFNYEHDSIIYPDSNFQLIVIGTDTHQCQSSDTLNINTMALPTLIIPNDTSVCLGDSLLLNATSNASVTWNGQYNNGSHYFVTQKEYLSAKALDNNQCIQKDSFLITPLSPPTIIAMPDTQICAKDSLQLTATGGSTYQWNTQTAHGDYYTITKTQEIWVKGTDNSGCSGYDTFSVELLERPMVHAGNDTSFCEGGDLRLRATGASTYQWAKDLSNGDVYSPFATEKLWVKGTATNGCNAYDTLSIILWTPPEPYLGRDTVLERDAVLDLYPGQFAQYQWKGGSTDSLLKVGYAHQGKGIHQFHVRVTTKNGCEGMDTIEVEILETGLAEAPLQYRLYPNPANQYLVIWVPENGTMYQFYDTRGALTSSGRLDEMGIRLDISGLAPGVYQMKLVDKKGSEAYEKVVVY